MKAPTIIWTLLWIVLAGAVFVRWYTHNHQPVDTVTTHCPSPTDVDWATTKLFESDRCYEFRIQEEERNAAISRWPSPGTDSRCCRYCGQGQACGDSCISQNDECHQLDGCACN